MMPEEKNIAELARETANDLTSIATNEVRLATAELSQNLEHAAKGLRETLAGAALLGPATTVFLIAVGFGLGTIDGLADWVAFLMVAVIAASAAFVMMKAGKDALDPANLLPKKAFKNLRRDAQTVKEAAQ